MMTIDLNLISGDSQRLKLVCLAPFQIVADFTPVSTNRFGTSSARANIEGEEIGKRRQ
jgi:hypothetical protein